MPVATVTMLSQLLPGRDGALHSVTVIPVIAFGSYDNPEINRVVNSKDGYREVPMCCSTYVAQHCCH